MIAENTGTIRIKKVTLLRALRKNKEKHIKQYERAVIGFRKKALQMLEAERKKVEKGNLRLSVSLTAPVKRVEWYDKMITMYSAEIGEVITLSHNEFNNYVQDLNGEALLASASNTYYANYSKGKSR